MSGDHDESHLDALKRALRDPSEALWRAACAELATLAVDEYLAREEIQRLATCPNAELRLRGIHALAYLAEQCPEEARQIFFELLEEEEAETDPVFTEALFQIVAHLPPQMACHIVDDLCDDGRETVRSAVAGALLSFRGWRPGLVVDLARDPSDQVRCTLALTLASVEKTAEVAQALAILEAAPEPHVRAFVAEACAPPRVAPPRASAGNAAPATVGLLRGAFDPRLTSSRLAVLLRDAPCSPALAAEVEEVFALHPRHAGEVMLALIETVGLPSLLGQLVWMARDPEVAALCRILHPLCAAFAEVSEHTPRLLLEALEGQQGLHTSALRDVAGQCVSATRASDVDAIIRWASTADANALAPLVQIAEALQECTDLALLSEVHASLPGFAARLEAEEPVLHRHLMRAVIGRWGDVIDSSLEEMVSEMTS